MTLKKQRNKKAREFRHMGLPFGLAKKAAKLWVESIDFAEIVPYFVNTIGVEKKETNWWADMADTQELHFETKYYLKNGYLMIHDSGWGLEFHKL